MKDGIIQEWGLEVVGQLYILCSNLPMDVFSYKQRDCLQTYVNKKSTRSGLLWKE